jgi:ATP-dependent DNA ligase
LNKRLINIEAMEARSVDFIPAGFEWQYEPKWDGFRCLLTRDADAVTMYSKSGQDLRRYFPEVVAAALALREKNFILDGEIVVPVEGRFSFDDLLQRIHPAASQEVGRANSGFVSCIRPFEKGRERA